MTILSLVAAMARHRVIGINNSLPWHLPEDLRHFKELTWNKPVIMGRKTFDSISRPLPGRRNIVVTRQQGWSRQGVETALSVEAALMLVSQDNEACLIGGAELYCQALRLADRLYLTEIDAEFDGDAFFPAFDRRDWQEVTRHSYRSQFDWGYAFVEYRRCDDSLQCAKLLA